MPSRATPPAAMPSRSSPPAAMPSRSTPPAAVPPRASPASTRASGRFGVITVASGSSRSIIAWRAASSSSTAPDSATITGSITTGTPSSSSSSARATASTVSAVPSIPIFTASTPMSSATARTCSTMNAAGTVCTPVTPTVFCAVNAAIAVIPCTPQRAKAFRSAWIPAPPPESEPAIESTAGTGRDIDLRLGAGRARSPETLDGLRALVRGLVVGDPDHPLAALLQQRLALCVFAPCVVVVCRAVRLDDEALLWPAEVGDHGRVVDPERDVDVGVGEAGLGDQVQDEVLEHAAGRCFGLVCRRDQAERLRLSSCPGEGLGWGFDAFEVLERALGCRGRDGSVDNDITKEGARSGGVDARTRGGARRRDVGKAFDRLEQTPVEGGGEVAECGTGTARLDRREKAPFLREVRMADRID